MESLDHADGADDDDPSVDDVTGTNVDVGSAAVGQSAQSCWDWDTPTEFLGWETPAEFLVRPPPPPPLPEFRPPLLLHSSRKGVGRGTPLEPPQVVPSILGRGGRGLERETPGAEVEAEAMAAPGATLGAVAEAVAPRATPREALAAGAAARTGGEDPSGGGS